jgi:uncharacterized protein YqeY
MSNLVSRIDEELKAAMRAKDAVTLNTLRLLKSAVKYGSIEKHGADGIATDDEVITAVRREIKKRQDSIDSYTKAGRTESAAAEQNEIEILKTFLPASLSDAELEALVDAAISEVGATSKAQMGAVMKVATAKAGGRADGKVLSQLVQKKLA